VKLSLPSRTVSVACGAIFSGALSKEGDLFLWGDSTFGQLGAGNTEQKNSPQKVPLSEKVIHFCCGFCHVMALTEKGNLFSWGYNCSGQLGVKDYSIDQNTPTLVSFDFGDSISSIATGHVHSMAFTKSGNIFVWGCNICGQLGLGDNTNRNKPHLLSSSFSPKIFKPPFQNSEILTNFLLHLLDSGEFSDVTIFGKPLHKCIIHARSPKFLSMDLSSFQKSVVISVIHFFYSNSTEFFSDLKPEEICSLILLLRSLEIPGLLSIAQKLLVDSLTAKNAFHVLIQSVDLGLSEEIEWILWFIRKNKISPPVDSLKKLFAISPTITARALREAFHLSLPSPNILTEPLPSIVDHLEKLFISGEFSDFPLYVGGTVLPLHKCILSSWEYSRILFHNRSHTLQMPLETFKKILLFIYS